MNSARSTNTNEKKQQQANKLTLNQAHLTCGYAICEMKKITKKGERDRERERDRKRKRRLMHSLMYIAVCNSLSVAASSIFFH